PTTKKKKKKKPLKHPPPTKKKTILSFVLVAPITTPTAKTYHYVRPYYRHNGTFVSGHYQTNPDGNIYNNWSTYPNINPFTGRQGTIRPYGGLHTMPYSNGWGSGGAWGNDD